MEFMGIKIVASEAVKDDEILAVPAPREYEPPAEYVERMKREALLFRVTLADREGSKP